MGSQIRDKATIWTHSNRSAVPSVCDMNCYIIQTAIRSSLVSHTVLLMPSEPRNASMWFNSIGKKLSVKADLAIYAQVFR